MFSQGCVQFGIYFEKSEDILINLAISISYYAVLSNIIKEKYDLEVDDILEQSRMYDSLWLYLIHIIYHDTEKKFKPILTTFQYIEYQNPGEATFELISHINQIVCGKDPIICRTKKKRLRTL